MGCHAGIDLVAGIAAASAWRVNQRGAPPQIVRLEQMDYPTEAAAELIRRHAIAISEFEKSARAVMILRRSTFPLLHEPFASLV